MPPRGDRGQVPHPCHTACIPLPAAIPSQGAAPRTRRAQPWGEVPRIHPGGATITPLQLGPPQQGAGNWGRQVPGGSGSGRTALPALGPLHILPAMPSGARCLPAALPLFLFVVAQAVRIGAARPRFLPLLCPHPAAAAPLLPTNCSGHGGPNAFTACLASSPADKATKGLVSRTQEPSGLGLDPASGPRSRSLPRVGCRNLAGGVQGRPHHRQTSSSTAVPSHPLSFD